MSGYHELAGLVTIRPMAMGGRQLSTKSSPFRANWTDTVNQLADELRHLRARAVVLELDVDESDLRLDGLPRASARIRSPWVIVSMDTPHGPLRYEVGTYDHWQSNVRAIAKSLTALRAVDRYGVTRRGEQYAGWRQLTAGGPNAERGRELIREHGGVKAALLATHPDQGGDASAFADVQAAREETGDGD